MIKIHSYEQTRYQQAFSLSNEKNKNIDRLI